MRELHRRHVFPSAARPPAPISATLAHRADRPDIAAMQLQDPLIPIQVPLPLLTLRRRASSHSTAPDRRPCRLTRSPIALGRAPYRGCASPAPKASWPRSPRPIPARHSLSLHRALPKGPRRMAFTCRNARSVPICRRLGRMNKKGYDP
jgi:hypothetical protein